MTGIKNFVLGFSLSLFSVYFGGQLYYPAHPQQKTFPPQNIKIDLFKANNKGVIPAKSDKIFAQIKKQSLAPTPIIDSNIPVAFSTDGIEDDEILSINLDGNIPIEFGAPISGDEQAEVLWEDSEDKTAMLPTDLREDETFTVDTPWVAAKGSPNIRNKKLLEQISQPSGDNLFTEDLATNSLGDDNLSYKVAEKIKQSIIFPIPDEILNDENLTPTFIHNTPKKAPTPKAAQKKEVAPTPVKKAEPFKIIDKQPIIETTPQNKEEDSKGILDSISTWFSDKPVAVEATPEPAPKKKAAPAYSSQGKQAPVISSTNNNSQKANPSDDLASFYESLQKTKKEYTQRTITPSELKLSFQPKRAEISGTTLHWLKIFSEAAADSNTYLQIRLDASASTELQKKRLNLLYTIFMNNGVDFKKVDTVFSLTEPNAFIIRTIKLK